MTDTRLVLVTTSVFVQAPADEEALGETLDRVSARLVEAVERIVSTDPALEASGVSTFHYPGDEDENARLCSRCGRWATDQNLPQIIDGLPYGYEESGAFMCDECHYPSREKDS